MASDPRSAPSARNSTFVTAPTTSEAAAWIVKAVPTVAPSAGLVTETVGGCGATTVTLTAAEVVQSPSSSHATANSSWSPVGAFSHVQA